MNLGIRNNTITVQDLYDFALLNGYVNSDVSIVLGIINRERNPEAEVKVESNVTPATNTGTIDFGSLVEYSYEDVLALFST